jgi:hypothetical protein
VRIIGEALIETIFIDKHNVSHTYYLEEGQQLIKDANGDPILRFYDEEFKMWVNIAFNNSDEDDCFEYVKSVLKKQVLSKYL